MQYSSQNPIIDLIIPVYKNALLTKRCIDSILSNISEVKHLDPRIILINDSPDDNETSSLLRAYANAESIFLLIENSENLGFVKSVNRGLNISIKDGRDVILINSDTETFPETLSGLVKVAALDSQIGFVSPRSNNASLCSLPHFYGGIVPTPQAAYDNWKTIASLLPEFHFTPTAIGFYLLIKNIILSNFGGLREDFGVGYEEENDLILRANKAGYRAVLANHSFAFHAGSASFGLLNFDLTGHQSANLQKMKDIHPEFIPLVQRYESSPHFRTEKMLSELVGLNNRNIEIVFELTGLACNHNGTNEFSLAVIRNFHERHSDTFNITVLCSPEAFAFHGLNELQAIRRENEWNPGTFTIAVKLGQPFDLHQINIMEDLAPINFYAMLDTIADDCGYLSVTQNLDMLWQHVASFANGIIYISKFSEKMFVSRFPDSANVPSLARLLPTKLASYPARLSSQHGRHVLILGNHFAHKGSDATAKLLSAKFPRIKFVVLGANTTESNNLQSYRSGTLTSDKIDSLFSQASVVVLPSYVEGFGLGLLHALSRKKVVFAREIEVTCEILGTYKSSSGVHLYKNDLQLVNLMSEMLQESRSDVDDSSSDGWEEWVDGFAEFCKASVKRDDIFTKSRNRLRQTDILRRAGAWDKQAAAAARGLPADPGVALSPNADGGLAAAAGSSMSPASASGALSLDELLAAEGSRFVELVYSTFLKRPPDPAGETYYYSRLIDGISKLKIIQEISSSEESRKLDVKMPGLAEALLGVKTSRRTRISKLVPRFLR